MSGFQQTQQMLNSGVIPTAMLVANDQMALGVMRAITESGLRVATDISLIGYDDTEDSSCYIPPLTTIRQDFAQLGRGECRSYFTDCRRRLGFAESTVARHVD
ncbi:lac repressor [Salmonella enterica subsp. arizonae]|uniref:Lac repressor n=1 Tax=Salmonella enterica subsp. arizonae TaxID=59203 RepID=A0A447R9B4_SALER|nr:lac repressor [Salmonella enterica subsp. arizonae]